MKRQSEAAVVGMLAHIDARLAAHGGPWLLGDRDSARDPYAFMLCRWTRGFRRRARDHVLRPVPGECAARPAAQQAVAVEKLPQPVY